MKQILLALALFVILPILLVELKFKFWPKEHKEPLFPVPEGWKVYDKPNQGEWSFTVVDSVYEGDFIPPGAKAMYDLTSDSEKAAIDSRQLRKAWEYMRDSMKTITIAPQWSSQPMDIYLPPIPDLPDSLGGLKMQR